jgi:dephospho-CoA kinase
VAEAISSAVAQQPAGVMILDIPLLVESKRWRKHLDAVVVVDCSPATQAQRVRQRNGWANDTIAAVIHAQAPRELRLSAADMVVHNDGVDLTALQSHVAQLAHWLGL